MKVFISKYKSNGLPRTVRISISEDDTFSLDHTLAKIIHPALVKFKEGNTGYPSSLNSRKWEEILDKMIWSFERIADDSEVDVAPCPSDYGLDSHITDEGYHSNHDEWRNSEGYKTWKKDYEEYRSKMKEGLKLFGKYYESLWC